MPVAKVINIIHVELQKDLSMGNVKIPVCRPL